MELKGKEGGVEEIHVPRTGTGSDGGGVPRPRGPVGGEGSSEGKGKKGETGVTFRRNCVGKGFQKGIELREEVRVGLGLERGGSNWGSGRGS